MTTETTMMMKIDGDRIDRTDEIRVMRRRMRRNDARRDANANVKKNGSASVTLGQNGTETKRTTSHVDSSTTPMTMTAVASHTGRTVTGSGNGNGRKCQSA